MQAGNNLEPTGGASATLKATNERDHWRGSQSVRPAASSLLINRGIGILPVVSAIDTKRAIANGKS